MTGRHSPAADEVIDHAAARRNGRWFVALVLGLVVLGAAVGVVVGATRHSGRHHHSIAALVFGIGISLAVVLVMCAVLLRMYRRPNYSRVLQFGWRRRSRVAKALRRGRPVADDDLPVADALVRTMRNQRWVPYLFGAVVLANLVTGLTHHGFERWNGLGVAALYVLLLPVIIWQRRRVLANYDRLVAGRTATS